MNEIEWHSTKNKLPLNSKRILFTWINEYGKKRTGLGFYIRDEESNLVEHCCCDESCGGELECNIAIFNEEKNTCFLKQGWFESSGSDEYLCHIVNEVTHWASMSKLEE